jgi:tape measure domain-containing protein
MAQLELSVVLNLANFRTQLGKLAQASAAYYYPINLTIDKQAFKKQLAALGNIKPVIKIEDSQLDGARARIATLNKSLATLRRATSTAIEIKVKYKEEGLPAAGTGAVGRAITGRAGGEEALANKSRGELQKLYGLFREANLRVGELSKSLGKSSAEEIRQSLVPAFSDSGEEAVNGLAIGLKDPSSKISKAAKRLTVITIQDVKKGFGIASPSRVFKEIGKDLVAGLEIGFEDFNELRAKMVGKMRELVAVMRMEAAKVSDVSAQGQFRRFLQQQQASRVRGSRAYTSPIGPLPVGSSQPYAQGTRGQFGDSGYEPRMVSRLYTGTPQFPSSGMMGPSSPLRPMGQFPMSGMMYPSSPVQSGQSSPFSSPVQSGQSSRLASPLGPGYLAVGKGLAGIESAYGQAKGFLNTNKFPAAGAIAGLGSEFGNAIKQVLLFGTAYKALAFLTSLPGEAFEAAKGLATYKNQLQAVTAESGTFEQSFAFVDGLAARFNVPLDSARQGFIKLYASMEPAGFDQGQIEGLFTGISKASAAFGLSADKVDRVNYAFAQMASKGQIMSEELKGQLGDVLPGALGLFAEAAQMSIPEFSKAMEDGAFKGKAMEQVLGNVSILLNTKFGPAAEGAAKTLQGAVNQIQNNLSLMYQSFAPIVDGVAAAFGPQVNSLIKDVTDTVKVLTTTLVGGGDGFDTLSPRAQAFYAAVQTLEPALRQAGAAIADLGSRLAQLAPLFVEVLATAISFASSPLARAALLAAVAIGTLTAALKVLEVTGLKAALKAVYSFISSLAVGIPQATGIARVALIGLKLAVTGLFIGAVLVGLDLLIGKILEIGGAAQKSIDDVKQLAADLDRLVGAQDMIGLATKRQEAENQVIIAERLLEIYQKVDRINKEGGYGYGALSAQQNEFLKQYGKKTLLGGINVQPGVGIQSSEKQLASAMERRGLAQKSLETASRLAEEERRRRAAQTTTLTEIDLSGETEAGKLDAYDRSTLDFIKQEGELEQQSLDRKRQQNLLSETQYKIDSASLALEVTKKEEAEKLRLATLATNKDNLSSGDKILKLADLQTAYQNNLAIAQDKYTTAVDGARKELSGPFDSAIKDTNASMVEQRMLLGNLQNGIEGLTPDQQAYLKVVEMTRDLSQDETDILKDKINLLRGAIEQQILLNQEVEQGKILNELGGQLRLAQTLDPRAELRETLRQRNPLFSETKIEEQALLSEQVAAAQKAKDDLKNIASTIGNAFGEAFKGIITGTATVREALGGLFQSIADSFADMVAQMIAEWLNAQLIKGFLSLFPGFGGGGLGSSAANVAQYAPLGYANGGIVSGGFQAFANGGIVTGPTLGLVGEGRYNEAVIPLPDGKSVPVDLGGMAGGMGGEVTSNIVVNINNGQMQGNGNSNGSELGRKIEGAVKQVLVSELRPGGILSSGRR